MENISHLFMSVEQTLYIENVHMLSCYDGDLMASCKEKHLMFYVSGGGMTEQISGHLACVYFEEQCIVFSHFQEQCMVEV